MRRKLPLLSLLAVAMVFTVAVPTASARSPRVLVDFERLSGAREVTATCAPPTVCGDPDAKVWFFVVVSAKQDVVCYWARWWDIDGTVTMAHIHVGAPDVAGPVVVPLFQDMFDSTDHASGCVSAAGNAAAIVGDPSAYYLNIHSTVYPAGAARAQMGW